MDVVVGAVVVSVNTYIGLFINTPILKTEPYKTSISHTFNYLAKERSMS